MSKELAEKLIDNLTLAEVEKVLTMILCGKSVDKAIEDVMKRR